MSDRTISPGNSLSASQRVHVSLRSEILDGNLHPGDALSSERILAEQFEVNRHAVREALKRLEQAGLVQITHGGATRVLDWRDAAGLEVLLDLTGDSSDPPREIIRSVVEMRASIGIDAARLCAVRADDDARRKVSELAERAAPLVGEDEEQLDILYAELWQGVVAGSGNIAYRLALNSLLKAMLAFDGVSEALRPEDGDLVLRLGRAVGEGDADRASRAAGALLEGDVLRFT
ncbi:MAG: GntR family transcriptional regulator [Actinomycetota bacterium]|nr:GntR family transcriptional regulator [Actinomycetota bacterium]